MAKKKSQIIKLGIIATATISAVASSIFPAAAIKYGTNDVYRVGSGSSAVIYFDGTPSSSISADIGYVSRLSSKLAGACGEIVLSNSSIGTTSTIKVGSLPVTLSSLSTQLLPSCTNGSFAEARSSNFKTPDGKVVIVGNTPGSSVTLDIPKATVKTIKINECGFGYLKGSDSTPLPSTFKIGSTTYTVSSLPDAGMAPKCSSGVGYVPASWSSGGGSAP
ncbi:hypothetical protein BV378_20265 [Nostoc sp. RF31YmG]|jgi:hypothetical protein|nr:hypothetical protein BV378_20265 [Nostoc sp. RF31YmG]